ncbi:cytochrome P450 family protein [Kutzneria sp. CA-103260]|uniref:cytochrome P450 family protein n=1 Tax=Kutzneria sp. CA-103260 TaxID=2802641 RepID=UPI001BA9C658|nr:cytochrome P450 [Kutzneria sp. CA-103260]QUQ68648.1 cytochrome P450 [Kutzneria sp. CA-103260]
MSAPLLFGPAFDADPSPAYDWLRVHSPVHRVDFPGGAWAWLITRYDHAVEALRHPALAKNPALADERWQRSEMGLPLDHRPSLVASVINRDGADHARLRKSVTGAFTPRRIRPLREHAERLTVEFLDRIADRGHGDLVTELAYPLPMAVICDLLGVPESDREELHRWALVIDSSDDTEGDNVRAATDALDGLVAALVERKRREPGPDLVSDLIAQQERGELTADEVTSTAFLILIGGHETTVGLIGSAALALLTHPEHADRARTDPAVLEEVVEETLRLHSPLQNATWRFPTEQVEIGGQRINPGDPVLVSVLAANRDPERFEHPTQFRLGREERHIAFGVGPHICLGAALARLQGEIAIGTMLHRCPGLELAEDPATLRWWPSPITRGLYNLPVWISP